MTGEMQSPDALISVIVPVCCKAEQTLDRCVGSIVSQTYRNLEIILVDDGSPDDCPAMCDTWSVKDARIKVVHQKNGGVTKARNTGLASVPLVICWHGSIVTIGLISTIWMRCINCWLNRTLIWRCPRSGLSRIAHAPCI